ncbi:IclR family transcriptional regulator [Woeseia oceani]|nr:IclR family transcriptional regulator [Woeseia oceani]
MRDPRPPQGAQSALRAIRLLKLFTPERAEMTLAELSAAAELNKTTTHRLLQALQSESLIERNAANSAYSLGPGLMALGVQALASSDLRRRVRPLLRALARDIGETATLEVPVENSMLILDEVAGGHVISAAGNIGTRWPLHATSTGKAWLAFDNDGLARLSDSLPPLTRRTLTRKAAFQPELTRIRRCGYAVTVDELEDGFTAIATVIRSGLGEVQGALSIGGPTQRLGPARRAEIGASLCKAAIRLSPEY